MDNEMPRNPVGKLERRLGVDLGLKGVRAARCGGKRPAYLREHDPLHLPRAQLWQRSVDREVSEDLATPHRGVDDEDRGPSAKPLERAGEVSHI
jgi:hypothetical protein